MGRDPVTEAGILQAIRLALGQYPQVYVVRRTVGRLWTDGGAPIQIGVPGEPDLQGIVGGQTCPVCGYPVHPLPFGIEVKTVSGRQSPTQQHYQHAIWERRGGRYILARSIHDATGGLCLPE